MSIQYYGLAKDEELPEEFCAIRHEHGEPSEYRWYIPEPRVETDETGLVTRVEIDGRWYVPERTRLEAENAELVRVLHELEQEAIHAYRCLQEDCGQALESEQHFFRKWWSSDCENDELRKLVRELWQEILREYPRGGFPDMGAFERRLRELGIEVDE